MAALLLSIALCSVPAEARYASIVVDAETGQVLHAANADTQKYPASLTKIMTLYMTFEALETGRWKLNQTLKASKRAAGMSPSKLGLKAGDRITVKDAILALITKSANDAAVVIAESLGGTEIKFAKMMTAKARQLGMKRTSFRNASGLPNRRQKSTARDMAKLAIALRRDFPKHYAYFSTQKFTYRGRTYRNHNKLLARYEGTDGIKTGYIRASGFNLVASVTRNNRRLIGVVFGGKSSRSRDAHMVKLLDRGFRKVARGVQGEPPRPQRNPLYPGGKPLMSVQAPAKPAKKTVVAAPVKSQTVPAKPTATVVQTVALTRAAAPVKQQPKAVATVSNSLAAETLQRAWGVQVGAFATFAPAHRAATSAAQRLPGILTGSKPVIRQMNLQDGRIYRAQLAGLSEQHARQACRNLEAMGQPCVVVAPASASGSLLISGNS